MRNTSGSHRRNQVFSRRKTLWQVAGLSIGLPLYPALAGQASPNNVSTATAKSCILIWLDGGPSHLETFDMKPRASTEVRGPLNAISSAVSGIQLSECLPQLAQRMRDIAIIRSMTSPLGEHNLGAHYLLTGYRPTPVLTYPSFHTVASHQLESVQNILPNNIAIPEYRPGGAGFDGVGFLPNKYGAFSLGSDPADKNFSVQNLEPGRNLTMDRIRRRQRFAKQLSIYDSVDRTFNEVSVLDRAFQMITAPEAATAFRMDDESDETRRRFGPKTVGQSCLLARRLVERGVRFVTVKQSGWDTHSDLYTRLKEGYTGAKVGVGLIPSLDLAVSALIDDLKERGLLDETLVVIMGEFGRTPKINTQGGRDHWPRVFSMALAGGGISGGQVIGCSDAVGESPSDRPISPSDVVSSIYTALGIDPAATLTTSDGRPVRLVNDDAKVVTELFS